MYLQNPYYVSPFWDLYRQFNDLKKWTKNKKNKNLKKKKNHQHSNSNNINEKWWAKHDTLFSNN